MKKSPVTTTRRKRDELPIYARIAIDIAYRIVNDEIPIGKKLSGRSKMSSEYGVSPETIRRSMALLAELEVVEVQESRGVYAISKENAMRYLERHGSRDETRKLLSRMQELINTKEEINRELYSIMKELVRYGERFTASNPFYTYESIVGESSPTVSKTLGELSFWQRTQATVIAVRRRGSIILSPGPDFAIEPLDVLILVGDAETRLKVDSLIS